MSIYFSALAMLLAANKSTPYPPLDSITGLDSYVEQRAVELDTTPQEWNSTWQKHKGITPIGNANQLNFPTLEQPPTVDFDDNVVLVIFGGLASQGGYEVVDAAKTLKEVDVRIRALPTALNGGNSPKSFKANPYLFVVFKKTNLPFAVQVQRADQDGNVQWQTISKVGGTSVEPVTKA